MTITTQLNLSSRESQMIVRLIIVAERRLVAWRLEGLEGLLLTANKQLLPTSIKTYGGRIAASKFWFAR